LASPPAPPPALAMGNGTRGAGSPVQDRRRAGKDRTAALGELRLAMHAWDRALRGADSPACHPYTRCKDRRAKGSPANDGRHAGSGHGRKAARRRRAPARASVRAGEGGGGAAGRFLLRPETRRRSRVARETGEEREMVLGFWGNRPSAVLFLREDRPAVRSDWTAEIAPALIGPAFGPRGRRGRAAAGRIGGLSVSCRAASPGGRGSL